MPSNKLLLFLLVVFLLPLTLTACGSGDATESPSEETQAAASEVTESLDPEITVDPSGQTVAFWHVWGSGLKSEVLQSVVDEFNVSNEWGIIVESLYKGRYSDLESAMNEAIRTGEVPTSLVGYSNVLANWYMVDIVVNFNDFIYNPVYGLSDEELESMYDGTFNGAVTTNGERAGWPISQSANVMFYNVTWAQELGFDSPPSNAAEFKEQACAASAANDADGDPDNDGTGGLVMYAITPNVMSFIYAFGGNVLNDAGDGYDFTGQDVVDVALYLKDLQDSGCTLTTESYPNPEFASRKALFVMSSTTDLPFQLDAFEDAGNSDEWTLFPFLGPNGNMAVIAFGQYVAIVSTTPEQDLASWLFIKYLTSPEVQAQWSQASAYFPTQSSTVPLLADYSANNPIWALGLDLAQYGNSEPALASWTSVRSVIQDAFFTIMAAETEEEVLTILEELNITAAELVAELQ
ncbi:MAG: extracellular solute-binding protein [Chloroflexi bacterium]|nr:extracellular solute-binding protein [Chloroflexota bacterium]